jgi:predicted ATPase
MNLLSHLSIQGFRSIKSAEMELRRLNVMIGANGAGKSNLIDFFRMLNYALSRGFQDPYQRERGPASGILHFGSKTTGVIRAELKFNSDQGVNCYRFTLADTAGDRLTFTKEEVQFLPFDGPPRPVVPLISHPSDNSGLCELWAENDPLARFAKRFLERCRVYQFHDTSLTSHLRDYTPASQNRYLYADGGNLSAVLLGLRQEHADCYLSICRTLKTVLPWFDDFLLEDEGRKGILLRWRMAGRGDYLLGPEHLSDGSLRIMALVTLLHLPEAMLPAVIIVDEPELGLHPVAEQIIAGLFKHVSSKCQVILSTQSSTFIDHFSADDLIVVEHENGESSFKRQSTDELARWLERYSLGQIWSKNIVGGRP